jgi:hypothetical protein
MMSAGLNLGVDDADEKSVQEVMEVVWAAREQSDITYVDFNTGHYTGHTVGQLAFRRNTPFDGIDRGSKQSSEVGGRPHPSHLRVQSGVF